MSWEGHVEAMAPRNQEFQTKASINAGYTGSPRPHKHLALPQYLKFIMILAQGIY